EPSRSDPPSETGAVTSRARSGAAPAPPPTDRPPTFDELTDAWADVVLPQLRGMPKALFAGGHWVSTPDGPAFAVVNHVTKQKCEKERPGVEAVLATHFGRPVAVPIVVEGELVSPTSGPGRGQPSAAEPDEV